jgi:transposase-like protein
MPKGKRYTPEQIITKLREAEVLQSQGMSVEEAARTLEIASQTYYRWRKEYGDMNTTQVLIEMWRKHYNTVRPHSSLGYKPPVPATIAVQPSQIQQASLTL